MAKNRIAIAISILVLMVLILGFLVAYAFIVKPVVSGYVINAQNSGMEQAIVTIVQLSQNCQIVPLTIGEETTQLINVDCIQQQPQEIGAIVG